MGTAKKVRKFGAVCSIPQVKATPHSNIARSKESFLRMMLGSRKTKRRGSKVQRRQIRGVRLCEKCMLSTPSWKKNRIPDRSSPYYHKC
jgi:hypothetical protein